MNLNNIALPLLHKIDPEKAHDITVWCLSKGLYFKPLYKDDAVLKTSLWGMDFDNPLGLSAGFDKNAECYNGMLDLGMGFVEVGSITPQAQSGNPKPRLFRLPKDKGVLNRFGFNNLGMENAFHNLNKSRRGLVGVNLGKNKITEDPVSDFVLGAEKLSLLADYLVVNVSSPNTPGLRALQGEKELTNILSAVQKKRNSVCEEQVPPLLVKIAPDLSDDDVNDVISVVQKLKIDGIIVSNTTLDRPKELYHQDVLKEAGGLSGTPVFQKSTLMLEKIYRKTKGQIPLIGVGGIASGRDAYEKICRGASLVQLYSSLVYGGAGLITDIKKELAQCLKADGFTSLKDAVGSKVKG